MDTFLTRVGYKKLAVHKKQGIDWTPQMTDLLSHSPRAVLGPFACDQAVRHALQIKVMVSPGAKVYDAKIPPGRDWSQFRRNLADLDRTWERVLLRHDNGVTNGSAGWSVDCSRLMIQYQGGVFGTISLRSLYSIVDLLQQDFDEAEATSVQPNSILVKEGVAYRVVSSTSKQDTLTVQRFLPDGGIGDQMDVAYPDPTMCMAFQEVYERVVLRTTLMHARVEGSAMLTYKEAEDLGRCFPTDLSEPRIVDTVIVNGMVRKADASYVTLRDLYHGHNNEQHMLYTMNVDPQKSPSVRPFYQGESERSAMEDLHSSIQERLQAADGSSSVLPLMYRLDPLKPGSREKAEAERIMHHQVFLAHADALGPVDAPVSDWYLVFAPKLLHYANGLGADTNTTHLVHWKDIEHAVKHES